MPGERDGRTENIQVGALRRELEAEKESPSEPTRPPSTRLTPRPGRKGDDGRPAIAWLCCDPLPPIPLGPQPVLTVGRGDGCDLVLPHKEVSRRHGVVKVRGQGLFFEDEESSNGTYLNGKRVSSSVLRVGDRVAVGPYEIVIRSDEEMSTENRESDETTSNLRLASSSRSGRAAALSGRIEEVPVPELLQQLEFHQKTGALRIRGSDVEGRLVLAEGRPLSAWLGELQDREAVIAMTRLETGRFSFAASEELGERTMEETLTGLLLEASRRVDEDGEDPSPGLSELVPDAGHDPSELDEDSDADATDVRDEPPDDEASDGRGEPPDTAHYS